MTRTPARVQYGNSGIEFRVTLRNEEGDRLDLTTNIDTADSARVFIIQRPSGLTQEKQAAVVSADTGILRAVFNASDLNELGLYKIQVWVSTPTTTYSSEVGYFEVVPNVGVPT